MIQPKVSDEATDDELLLMADRGDREAFRLLIRRYQGVVTRFACRLLNGDRNAAEDIGQEVFLRLYRRQSDYQARGELRAYLLTITRNLCRDHFRRQRATEPLDSQTDSIDPVPSGEAVALRNAEGEAVRRAIAALPEEQQAVLILSHYEGLTYQEIATILSCPTGTVASRRHLAIAALRRHLNAYHNER